MSYEKYQEALDRNKILEYINNSNNYYYYLSLHKQIKNIYK